MKAPFTNRIDMEETPFLASCSPTIKATLPLVQSKGMMGSFRKAASQALEGVITAPGVADSLKEPVEGYKVMRGITMRKWPGGPAFLDCYVFWNYHYDCWHILIESPEEGYWKAYHEKKDQEFPIHELN